MERQLFICHHTGCYLKSSANSVYHQIKSNEERISKNLSHDIGKCLDLTVLTPILELRTFIYFFFPSQKCVQLPLELELILMSIISSV